MSEITRGSLQEQHGDKAAAVFAEIALLGGFGEVGPGENQLDGEAALDLRGVLDADNKAVSEANKARIRELLGGKKKNDGRDDTK